MASATRPTPLSDHPPRGHNVSRILLVDDDADLRSVFREKLEYSGHEVDEADSAEVALAKVGAFDPALVVTDVRMDGMRGWSS